jgi:histone H2A
MTTSKKSGGLLFPTDYIHENLVSGKYAPDVTEEAAVHMSAVLQYMAKELLEISGNIAKDNKSPIIMPRHLLLAVRNDDELNKLFPDVLNTVTKPSLASVLGNTKKSKQSPSSSSINKQMSNLSL